MPKILKRRLVLWALLLPTCLGMLLTVASPATAQTRKKIAFLVGVSKYFHKNMENLNYAHNDVEVIGKQLRSLGFETTIITNKGARRSDVLARFDKFLQEAGRIEKEDIVFVMFSGHGQQLLSKQTKTIIVDDMERPITSIAETPYFCPHDAIPVNDSLRGKSESQIAKDLNLISMNRVIDSLDRKSNSTRNLLVIDACRNNPAKGKSINGDSIRELGSGLSIYFGAVSGQKSWESSDPKVKHGVLSYFIIEGLKGKAANRLHEITWQGLLSYVSSELRNDKGKLAGGPDRVQTPKAFSNLSGTVVLGKMQKRTQLNFPFSKQDIDSARKSWADAEGIEESFVNEVGYSMQLIPPGEFDFGNPYTPEQIATLSSSNVEDVRKALGQVDRYPAKSRSINRPFYIGKSEVTFAQFRAFIKDTGHQPADGPYLVEGGAASAVTGGSWKKTGYDLHDRGPVSNVSVEDAEAFCRWLSKKTGRTYRLPTDAEWEYVAKGGQKTLWHFGNDRNGLEQVMAKPNGLRIPTTQSGQPNPFGVYDLLGGVQEHCTNSKSVNDKNRFVTCGGQSIWWMPWARGMEDLALRCLPFVRGRSGVNYGLGFRIVCEVGESKVKKTTPAAGAFPNFEKRFPEILNQTESPFREYMRARPNKLDSVKMVDVAEAPGNKILLIAITSVEIVNGQVTAERICRLQSLSALTQNKGVLVKSLEELKADNQFVEEVKAYSKDKVTPLPQVAKWKSADGKRIYVCYGKVISKNTRTPKPVKTFRDFPGSFGKTPAGWVEKKLAVNEFTIAKSGLQLQGDFMLKFTVKSQERNAKFGMKLIGKNTENIELTGNHDAGYTWYYNIGGDAVRIPFHRTFCTHYVIKRGQEITVRVEQTTNPAKEDPVITNLIVKEDAAFEAIELSTFSRKIEISSISVHDLSQSNSSKPFTPFRSDINPYGKITPEWTVRTYKNSEFTIEKDKLNLAGDFTLDFRVLTRKQGSFFALRLLGTKDPNVTIGGLFHGSFNDGTNWIYWTPENLNLSKSVVHNENNYRLTREGAMMTFEALNAIRSDSTVISRFPVTKENSFHAIQLSTYSKDIQFKSISIRKK